MKTYLEAREQHTYEQMQRDVRAGIFTGGRVFASWREERRGDYLIVHIAYTDGTVDGAAFSGTVDSRPMS